MLGNQITEVLNRPTSRDLLARDITRLAYVAKDGTPRNVPGHCAEPRQPRRPRQRAWVVENRRPVLLVGELAEDFG